MLGGAPHMSRDCSWEDWLTEVGDGRGAGRGWEEALDSCGGALSW